MPRTAKSRVQPGQDSATSPWRGRSTGGDVRTSRLLAAPEEQRGSSGACIVHTMFEKAPNGMATSRTSFSWMLRRQWSSAASGCSSVRLEIAMTTNPVSRQVVLCYVKASKVSVELL